MYMQTLHRIRTLRWLDDAPATAEEPPAAEPLAAEPPAAEIIPAAEPPAAKAAR